MDFKLISYWLISIITLICCLFIPWNNSSSTTSEPLNLTNMLKVEPKFLYYSNNKYHAKIAGELKLNIKTDSFTSDYLQYDTVVINELGIDLNSAISLNWQVEDQLFQVQLNKTNTSITPFNFNATSIDQISNLHVLIRPNIELGRHIYLGREATFQSIYLDTQNHQKTVATIISEWFDFNPIKFNSINGYSDADNINHKKLIFRLMVWIIISIMLYRVFNMPGVHLIANLTIAWLLLFSIFSINFVNQHQQIQQAYPNNSPFLNNQDNEAFNIAQSIKSSLNSQPSWNQEGQKFIILGPQDFNYLRLFHHLLELNVGLSSNNRTLNNDKNMGNHIYILANKYQSFCSNPSYLKFIGDEYEILNIDQNACLVRKK